MQTKRKYAHELYPHPEEYEVLPLHKVVPYLYSRAVGFEVWGTDWFDLWRPEHEAEDPERARLTNRLTVARTGELIHARSAALHADALLQGLKGQEAWEWAESRMDESGECVYERAVHYGVPVHRIKPYPVLDEPDHHSHYSDMETRSGVITRIDCKESECPDCCDPDPVIAEDLFGDATAEPTSPTD